MGPGSGVCPGAVVSHGVDIVEVKRVARMLERHGDRFLERVFTEGERGYAAESERLGAQRLAVRFAAKEAVLKALGTGWRSGIAWTDVEVVRRASGEPGLVVGGRAGEVARARGIEAWLVSLSHTSEMGLASVIGLGRSSK